MTILNLEMFFSEKDLPFKLWEIKHQDTIYIIDSELVINHILSTRGEERAKIETVLSYIDFKNGDILGYLEFLGKCLIVNNV